MSVKQNIVPVLLPIVVAIGCVAALVAMLNVGVQRAEAGPAGISSAETTNLLSNPSFEGEYSSYVPPGGHPDCPAGICTTVQIADDWTPWWVSHDDDDDPWIIRMPEYKPAELWHVPPRVKEGARAQQYFTFYSTHRAGIYQRVAVDLGQDYCFQIWGHSWSSDDDDSHTSDSVLEQKIGIDPQGGTDWKSADIVWAGFVQQYNEYGLFTVCAEALADHVTVYTYSEPKYAVKHNDLYWDDGALKAQTPISGLMAYNDGPKVVGDVTTLSATLTAGTNVLYEWDFGDGAAGTGALVTYTYPLPGVYTAVVTASNPLSSLSATTTVHIVDEFISGLVASSDSPTKIGVQTNLTATITAGTNVSYSWAFGDGATGSGSIVTHTYPAPGIFTAAVTASNPANSQSASTIVNVVDEPITGLAAGNDSPTKAGSPTTLTATVTAGVFVTYNWAFGDGATGSGSIVTHTYPAVGIYTAVVTASNPINALSASTIVTVEQSIWNNYLPLVVKSPAPVSRPEQTFNAAGKLALYKSLARTADVPVVQRS